MGSSVKNHFIFPFATIIVLLFTVTIHVFSQSKNELSSVTSALFRNPESISKFSFLQCDTTYFSDSGKSTGFKRSLIIVKKVGLGGLLGTVFALPGALIGGSISKKDDAWSGLAGALVGGYIGYVFGSSYGVHLVSTNENPKSNFGLTLLSGCLGVGLGAVIISTITDNGKVGTSMAFILPIAFPILYTELIE
jgi:hypothetical protein